MHVQITAQVGKLHEAGKIRGASDVLPIEAHDEVPLLEAGPIGRPALAQVTRECYLRRSILEDRPWFLDRKAAAGGIMALLIRTELSSPGRDVVSADTYNQLFTMHGTTMIFLVVMPLGAAFFNNLVGILYR